MLAFVFHIDFSELMDINISIYNREMKLIKLYISTQITSPSTIVEFFSMIVIPDRM